VKSDDAPSNGGHAMDGAVKRDENKKDDLPAPKRPKTKPRRQWDWEAPNSSVGGRL
jgi:hypothetical protein